MVCSSIVTKVGIIVAVAENGIIGHKGGLPWDLPEDLRHFKRVTEGKAVIMGRRTFESIGRPLPNRLNVVVSSTVEASDGIVIASSFNDALLKCREHSHDEVFAIGGESIFREALYWADTLHITNVFGCPEGDTYFPGFDEDEWEVVQRTPHNDFEIVTYTYKG